MKSEKITSASPGPSNRWYDDACGTALALEFFGERWSLLVMRELMMGPRRFSELRASLSGISANVLTQRLTGLERSGVVVRRRLPPPASVQVYQLTAWGLEAEPILQTMGRWATRSPLHDPTLPLSPVSAMLSLRTMIARERGDLAMTLALRLDGDSFVANLSRDDLVIRRGEAGAADVTFDTDVTTFVTLIYLKRPLTDAEAEGTLRLTGDRAKAQAFVDLFTLPEKVA